MVDRFNGRISNVLKSMHVPSSNVLAETINHYLKIYNYHIPQKNIGHLTLIQKLKQWQELNPSYLKNGFMIYPDLTYSKTNQSLGARSPIAWAFGLCANISIR